MPCKITKIYLLLSLINSLLTEQVRRYSVYICWKIKIVQLLTTISETISFIENLKKKGGKIGFVATMGSLHDGHISLVNRSLEENDYTAVSIFVNPTQFNENKDFTSYPRNLQADMDILKPFPIDLVFAPPESEIYPEKDTRIFDFGGLDVLMEGKHRPGHFNGVAQVVSKLFTILKPDRAYFGEKDFQQLAIIRKITMDLELPVEIIGCPIIRESDGLAMSSRNRLMNSEQRASAVNISRALSSAREQAGKLPVEELIRKTVLELDSDPSIKTEYFDIVDAVSLQRIAEWSFQGPIRGCIAARIGAIRLIDNMDFSS